MNDRERKKQRDRRSAMRTLTLITQIGISMLVPIFLCFFIGLYLDKKLGTSFIMMIGFFVGAVSGFRNVYVLVMQTIKNNERSESDYNDDGKLQ